MTADPGFIDQSGPRTSAPLTAIAAAAGGVALNLAVFFAYHVLCGPRCRKEI